MPAPIRPRKDCGVLHQWRVAMVSRVDDAFEASRQHAGRLAQRLTGRTGERGVKMQHRIQIPTQPDLGISCPGGGTPLSKGRTNLTQVSHFGVAD